MKNNILAFCLIGLSSLGCAASKNQAPFLTVSFNAKKVEIPQFDSMELENEIVTELVRRLEDYAEVQKHRKLTMEEMVVIFQFIIHLLTTTQNSFSKHVEIMIQGKKIILPFSEEFLTRLYEFQEECMQQQQSE